VPPCTTTLPHHRATVPLHCQATTPYNHPPYNPTTLQPHHHHTTYIYNPTVTPPHPEEPSKCPLLAPWGRRQSRLVIPQDRGRPRPRGREREREHVRNRNRARPRARGQSHGRAVDWGLVPGAWCPRPEALELRRRRIVASGDSPRFRSREVRVG
jgi:hypothetical protein